MVEKLCECGCGQRAPICKYTNRNYGYIKGQPLRFIPGHQGNLTKWDDERRRKFHETMKGHPVSIETRRKISENHRTHGIKPPPDAAAKSNINRRKREASPSWKGGVSMVNGYRCVYHPDHSRAHPNGYVYEHIIVAETKLGRPLEHGEIVHHVDRNKLNNSPDNIQVFPSQAAHMRHHKARGDLF